MYPCFGFLDIALDAKGIYHGQTGVYHSQLDPSHQRGIRLKIDKRPDKVSQGRSVFAGTKAQSEHRRASRLRQTRGNSAQD